jgi:hypothetical protein
VVARIKVEIAGIEEVERLLTQLPTRVGRKLNNQAVRNASRAVATVQRREAPKGGTGDLARSVTTKAVKSRIPGRAVALAGVFNKEAPLARLIEFGTGRAGPRARDFPIVAKGGVMTFITRFARIFARSVQHPGIRPNPFITRGFDLAKNAGFVRYRDTMLRGLVREANKISARSAKL